MTRFASRDVRAALKHALRGGQALHVHRILVDRARAPKIFRDAIDRGENLAHLFDQDRDRLIATARELGIHQIRIDRPGTPGQHIDLVGPSLRRAEVMAAASWETAGRPGSPP